MVKKKKKEEIIINLIIVEVKCSMQTLKIPVTSPTNSPMFQENNKS